MIDPLPAEAYDVPPSGMDDPFELEVRTRQQAVAEATTAVLVTKGADDACRLLAIARSRLAAAIRRRQRGRP